MTLDLDALYLEDGEHASPDDGLCLMEAVAYFAGRDHTDAPPCVSPVLRSFGIALNDAWDDTARQQLKRFIPLLPGTAGDPAADLRRGWMATDWQVRVHTPAWLRLAGLTEQAAALEGLPELTDSSQLPSIEAALEAARKDAIAAVAAAGDAARAAAEVALWAAARAAAVAVGDAARAAAEVALAPTVAELRRSALELFERMIRVGGREVNP